jgi:hypothetical protein
MSADAQAVRNSRWSFGGFIKVYTEKDCKGGHNWILGRNKKAVGVRAFKVPKHDPYYGQPVHSWYKNGVFRGERTLEYDTCYPLKRKFSDKVLNPQ